MRTHAAIAQALSDLGVTTLFGLMGDSNMLYIVDFETLPGTRYIGAVEEGAAVSMSDGYARRTGTTGVVTVSHGPAATNSLTALTEAVRARTPLVVLTADAPAFPRGHAQRFDLQGLARLAGAGHLRNERPEGCLTTLSLAFHRAATESRPVVVDIPVDQVRAEIDYCAPTPTPRLSTTVAPTDDDAELARAVDLLRSARYPVVLAGLGARSPEARDAVVALADLLGALLASTLPAKGLFRGHPYDLGIIARVGHSVAARAVSQADCLLVFGSSLDDFLTMDGRLFAGKTTVQVDLDPSALGRHHPVDAAVHGDAGTVAARLHTLLCGQGATTSLRTAELKDELARFDVRATFSSDPAPGTLDLRTAVIELDEHLPAERYVVTDSGRFMWAPWRYLGVHTPGSFRHTMHFGSIGLGIGTGTGAAAADPDVPTVVVVGDVGAMMNLVELRTAAAHGFPLIVAVLNDGCYGAEYPKFQRAGYDPAAALVEWPDFTDVARALGCSALTLRTVQDFAQLPDALGRGGPLLLDIRCDPTIDIPPNPDQAIHASAGASGVAGRG